MRLSPRHHRFVEEYLVDLHPVRALVRMGWGGGAATERAWRLMQAPEMRAAIAAAMAARARRTGITQERVLHEYARIAFADLRDIADVGPGGALLRAAAALTDDAAAAIAQLALTATDDGPAVRWTLHDKKAALDRLARVLRFPDDATAAPTPRGPGFAARALPAPDARPTTPDP
jgi:phage terminase small subunit